MFISLFVLGGPLFSGVSFEVIDRPVPKLRYELTNGGFTYFLSLRPMFAGGKCNRSEGSHRHTDRHTRYTEGRRGTVRRAGAYSRQAVEGTRKTDGDETWSLSGPNRNQTKRRKPNYKGKTNREYTERVGLSRLAERKDTEKTNTVHCTRYNIPKN